MSKRRNARYQEAINALITLAEREADRLAGPQPKQERRRWSTKWDAAFHNAMNRLAHERKLRRLACQVRPSARERSDVGAERARVRSRVGVHFVLRDQNEICGRLC